MGIPFIDLKTQYAAVKNGIGERINAVLDHGQYVMGPEVKELEGLLANFIGTKHCVAVSSGTDALLISLMALDLKPTDEVIVPDFSFFGTAEVVALTGARCRFVDVDPRTFNLDPAKLECLINKNTKAIMPVSLYGQCADYTAINKIANKHGVPVIEDGAQSFGATQNGKKSLALTEVGCTSFFPSKPLGAYGDGGALFTDDDNLANLYRQILSHGQDGRYHHVRLGLNGRMDTLQAAILIEKMRRSRHTPSGRQTLLR